MFWAVAPKDFNWRNFAKEMTEETKPFKFIDELNVEALKHTTELQMEIGKLKYENQCLKIELEHYKQSETRKER